MKSDSAIFKRLASSKFRSKFRLDYKDKEYIQKIGIPKIESHAKDFVEKRLAPSNLKNDGRQTPFKGHPVFKAQHATATCCRKCLKKWHGIPESRAMNGEEQELTVNIIMEWIRRHEE